LTFRKGEYQIKELVSLFKDDKLHTNIDKSYKLSNIIEAHQYLETGRKVGNIVIINQK